MIRTTSRQLLDSVRQDPRGAYRPMQIGAAMDQTDTGVSGTSLMFTVPKGQVFLITDIVGQVNYYAPDLLTGFNTASPEAEQFTGITVRDTAAADVFIANFKAFQRWEQTFYGTTPIWKNAVPLNPFRWRLKYPVPVPGGWTVNNSGSLATLMANNIAVYGVCVDTNTARTLGFPCSPTTTAADVQYGIASIAPTTSQDEWITGRTGKSIHIVDVYIRAQAKTNTANVLALIQDDGSTSRDILRLAFDNPADMIDRKIEMDVFLKPGASLDAIATLNQCASISITYEWVDAKEVPGDHFWACIIPERPTPGTATVGVPYVLTKASTEATLYYPRRDYEGDSSFTKTSPTKGCQHILEGYVISVQKSAIAENDAADTTEGTLIGITTGTAGGQAALSSSSLTQSNYQLTPMFSVGGHDGQMTIAVDDVFLAGQKNDGSLWIDTANFARNVINFPTGLVTPSSTTADISGWAVTLWGRTSDQRWSTQTNRGV